METKLEPVLDTSSTVSIHIKPPRDSGINNIPECWWDALPDCYPLIKDKLFDLMQCYNQAVDLQDYIEQIWLDLYDKANYRHGETALYPAEASYEECLRRFEEIYDKRSALDMMVEHMDYVDQLLFYNALDARSAKSLLEPLAKGKNRKVIENVIEKLEHIYKEGRTTRLWNYFEEVINENTE